jgi:hypothetical protein
MKHNIQRIIILSAIIISASVAKAQNVDKLHAEEGLFNHLSVGLSTGLTGTGIDVAMPVHKLVTVKAGFSGWGVGDIKFKAINTATEITQMQMVEEDAVKQAQMVDKVELAAKPKFWNFFLLGEVHPFKNQPFYFSAGVFIGSQNFFHFRSTNDGALDYLYDANQKVEDYNQLYHTKYPPIGLQFGDYVFTADENGNIDVRMKTNAVKPYLGIGLGQHFAKKHRVSLAVDLGLLFWGSPKFVLNNGTEIDSSGKNAGIGSVLSWLKAWPNLEVRVGYKIF